jgi:16S rRNA (guanine527-N7)-methyltransferase
MLAAIDLCPGGRWAAARLCSREAPPRAPDVSKPSAASRCAACGDPDGQLPASRHRVRRFTFYAGPRRSPAERLSSVHGVISSGVRSRLTALTERFGLRADAQERFATLLELVAAEPSSITTVRHPEQGVDVHVADSLIALELEPVRTAGRIADLGSGGGFPGLALAIALPDAEVALVESVGRKCEFLASAARSLELENVEVVNGRAESWPAGLDAYDAVTVRALAPLPVLVEYAAPLLRVGGSLVAWKGRRDAAEEADGEAAAQLLGMETPTAVRVQPFRAATDRHLYVSSKVSSTPTKFPRRPGMARKRPLGVSTGR